MFVDVVLLGTAALLAGGAYFLKRHAGTLILAIMAGGLLAAVATVSATSWLKSRGVELTNVQTDAVVAVSLILLPAMIGWFAGTKSSGKLRRIIGAFIFGVVGATLVAPQVPHIFNESLVAQSRGDDILIKYQAAIVAAGLLYALLDLYMAKARAGKEMPRKK